MEKRVMGLGEELVPGVVHSKADLCQGATRAAASRQKTTSAAEINNSTRRKRERRGIVCSRISLLHLNRISSHCFSFVSFDEHHSRH